MQAGELLPTERAALLGAALASGRTFTTREAARLARISDDGARQMLEKMARVLPIYKDGEFGGVWKYLPDSDRRG